ncbi:MAG: cytochrome c family protein [Rhodospirillales bacterium]|nr:cytochrome c family protein [Alphaproteobacteria bacterium]MBL6947263.1 cytochrome c family protein [Rhodospirillales bacterium]
MNKAKFFAVALASALALTSGAAMAAGDAGKGKKVFNKCKACHSTEAGKKKIGPSMFGIVGRKAGTTEGYRFSEAMKASGLTWDEATLDKFLKKPKTLVKKTKMSFAGLKKDSQRADVIAYLNTLK